jgi:hypothetical protein
LHGDCTAVEPAVAVGDLGTQLLGKPEDIRDVSERSFPTFRLPVPLNRRHFDDHL